jgi:hypothetical protein
MASEDSAHEVLRDCVEGATLAAYADDNGDDEEVAMLEPHGTAKCVLNSRLGLSTSSKILGTSTARCDVSASFASYLLRVRVDRRVADPEVVNCWINSAWGRAWASLAKTDGVSQSKINRSKLALLPVPLPPLPEQTEIVRRVDSALQSRRLVLQRIQDAEQCSGRVLRSLPDRAFSDRESDE